ncbi:uncharacterized protein LOC117173391 [Belonocnema kinseyi]|uniref:uncharacterized protein LOC117173391 n=1 Tax=Belonocnema kinseyi TaxID=2817044 RepID=UPI00143D2761|nr:uncharacterized protein LOC117173391 [Belonocnema kinseyi]
MKCSAATITSFVIRILGCVVALRFIEPIQYEIQEKYGLTMQQLQIKCDSKDQSLYIKIISDQDKSSSVRGKLTNELVKKAKDKEGEVTESDWDKWTKEICILNKTLKEISVIAINKVQQCLDQKDQLNEEEKCKAQRDFFKNFCDKVQISAEWSYMASRVENS